MISSFRQVDHLLPIRDKKKEDSPSYGYKEALKRVIKD